MSVYIFDLDDTLVQYKKRMAVPRETWHVLRRLHESGAKIYVISYNRQAAFIAAQLGLTKYVHSVISGDPPRDYVIAKLFEAHPEITEFTYFDDNLDNIKDITQRYLGEYRIKTVHVTETIKWEKIITLSGNRVDEKTV